MSHTCLKSFIKIKTDKLLKDLPPIQCIHLHKTYMTSGASTAGLKWTHAELQPPAHKVYFSTLRLLLLKEFTTVMKHYHSSNFVVMTLKTVFGLFLNPLKVIFIYNKASIYALKTIVFPSMHPAHCQPPCWPKKESSVQFYISSSSSFYLWKFITEHVVLSFVGIHLPL